MTEESNMQVRDHRYAECKITLSSPVPLQLTSEEKTAFSVIKLISTYIIAGCQDVNLTVKI